MKPRGLLGFLLASFAGYPFYLLAFQIFPHEKGGEVDVWEGRANLETVYRSWDLNLPVGSSIRSLGPVVVLNITPWPFHLVPVVGLELTAYATVRGE